MWAFYRYRCAQRAHSVVIVPLVALAASGPVLHSRVPFAPFAANYVPFIALLNVTVLISYKKSPDLSE
jgi:hypothetical protein